MPHKFNGQSEWRREKNWKKNRRQGRRHIHFFPELNKLEPLSRNQTNIFNGIFFNFEILQMYIFKRFYSRFRKLEFLRKAV